MANNQSPAREVLSASRQKRKNMNLEEKAHKHAVEAFRGFLKAEHSTAGLLRDAIENAYIAGAAEALISQWKDAEKELPKPEKDVIVAYEHCGAFEYSHAWLSVLSNGTVAWCSNDDNMQPDKIRFWMELPSLPNTEKK